ncbi:hypothetical protein ACFQ3L_09690 [Lacticaseibacillus jixianensis]|uniref:Uncharacterized protein n=1 Tax=Lacticaseibacillus jixianensis TaxID=2486012 RepID=A0ABW4BC33_9LACO|nr:hypothetical protein [Lacticaseibacillus jixianensis]
MRVIDLLALLADQDKKTPVQLSTGDRQANLAKITTAEHREERQAILVPKKAGKPLHLWEFALLLDQPDLRMRYLYVQDEAGPRPLFGFQLRSGVIVVN